MQPGREQPAPRRSPANIWNMAAKMIAVAVILKARTEKIT